MLTHDFVFSEKARCELHRDDLDELDVIEAIVNAAAITKRIRSTNPRQPGKREYLYIIQGVNLAGIAIYTKGKLVREPRRTIYYLLVSSKRAM